MRWKNGFCACKLHMRLKNPSPPLDVFIAARLESVRSAEMFLT